MQLNRIWVDGCYFPFPLSRGKEVNAMELFLEYLKEVLKGITRALSAHIFQKTFLEKKKTTQRRDKQKGGSQHK